MHGAGSSSFTAIGTIEGKFDCGYLVKVKLGSEILNGVLYHSAQPTTPSPIAALNGAVAPYFETGKKRRRLGKKRRSRRREDPNYPKPNRSGYNFFFAEKHCNLKSLYPNKEREFTKIIGESWSNLSTEERMVRNCLDNRDLLRLFGNKIECVVNRYLNQIFGYCFVGLSEHWIEGQGEVSEGVA